ncbi:GTP cyclohydrolase I FolE [Spirochaetota bacterium]
MLDRDKIIKAVNEILIAIGEDPKRSGLKGTPERVAKMYEEIFSGGTKEAAKLLQITHDLEYDEMVVVKDIPFYSVCEHHMVPFFGVCHVAYVPQNKKIVGLSKLARVVETLSKKLQVQERFTMEIADAIMDNLNPKGAAVVVNARHLCMEMRGIKKPGSSTITSVVRGLFRKDSKTREEFLKLIE